FDLAGGIHIDPELLVVARQPHFFLAAAAGRFETEADLLALAIEHGGGAFGPRNRLEWTFVQRLPLAEALALECVAARVDHHLHRAGSQDRLLLRAHQ